MAVKIVKDKLMDRPDILPRHVEEAAAIFPIRQQPNIVSLLGWCNATVVVDYIPQELDTLLFDSPEVLDVNRSLHLALDAMRGLNQLHSMPGGPLAHADIQPRQFLIDQNGKLLLNDFNRIKYTGFSNLPHKKTHKCTFRTPLAKGKWRSPEEYDPTNSALTEKIDIYSTSLVLWSLRARKRPFGDLEKKQVYEKVRSPYNWRPKRSDMQDFPLEMQDLIIQAWDPEPSKRPSAKEMVERIEQIIDKYNRND